jgi:hypothetical protein
MRVDAAWIKVGSGALIAGPAAHLAGCHSGSARRDMRACSHTKIAEFPAGHIVCGVDPSLTNRHKALCIGVFAFIPDAPRFLQGFLQHYAVLKRVLDADRDDDLTVRRRR